MSKRILRIVVVVILVAFIFPFLFSMIVYERNFNQRYEVYEPLSRKIAEFPTLSREEHSFFSNKGQQLQGYLYSDSETSRSEALGLVIIAHGLGSGGQNAYMGLADYFASHDYLVFAYDATGNGESEGKTAKGMPQGLIDLDYAIRYIKENMELADLPLVLFGHSWGAHSSAGVLNLHPDIKAVVMAAGFNRTKDLFEEAGKDMFGISIKLFLPFVSLYERLKFGKYAGYNAFDGLDNSLASALIIHSSDDAQISSENSYDIFHKHYGSNPRFDFIQFKDRGHDMLWYSDDARSYRDKFNEDFAEYVEQLEVEFTPEIRAEYINQILDKGRLYEIDSELMLEIVGFYNSAIH